MLLKGKFVKEGAGESPSKYFFGLISSREDPNLLEIKAKPSRTSEPNQGVSGDEEAATRSDLITQARQGVTARTKSGSHYSASFFGFGFDTLDKGIGIQSGLN